MNTIYGLDPETDWDQILNIHCLKLAKQYHPDWYRWKLTNNYERAVFLKGDPVYPREATRYTWANRNLLGTNVLEIGCSTGYGCQFLPTSINYLGIDYDPIIVEVAQEQDWHENAKFTCSDIFEIKLGQFDTIIAFEVIEHLDRGLELVEILKQHCNRLLITVPWNEPKGFWGEHHKLHGLTESNFKGFQFEYIDEHGRITDKRQLITDQNRFNLMIMRWDRG
jgi:SAM-dependent methyltransferase